jgi:cytochrome c-type biogenesis protein CcmF
MFLGLCIGGSLALFAWRGPALRTRGGFETVSRESFLLFNNLLLLVSTALILIGTLYPLFLDALNMGKISVGPPYFNTVFLIPGLPLLFLLGVGMHAAWKKARLDDKKTALLVLLGLAAVAGVLVPILGYGEFRPMTAVGLTAGFFVILSSLYEPFLRLRKGYALPRSVIGMVVAHVGVGLFVIGVTVTETYRIEKDIALKPGESMTIKDYEFRFVSSKRVNGPNFQAVEGEVVISEGGKQIAVLHPQKRVYRVQRSPMTEAGIEVGWNRDLFVAMGEELGQGAWSMRLQYKPMVRFIWLGCLVMALGGLIAVTDRRYRVRARAATKVGASDAATAS